MGFPDYVKFFVGLFALVNPVGILPVFISLTSYQTPSSRNKTNRTANLSVAIILWISLFMGDGFLQVFGISIYSFRIAGGILIMAIAMSMVSGKIGEEKQNKQELSESSVKENIGVVPLALPLLAGPGAISSTIVWSSKYTDLASQIGLAITIAIFATACWALFKTAPLLVRLLGQTGINVITRIMGIVLMALGVEFLVAGFKGLAPGLFS